MNKLANWGPWAKLGFFLVACSALSLILLIVPCTTGGGCGVNGGDIAQAAVTMISAIIGASVIGWQVRVGIEHSAEMQKRERLTRLRDRLLPLRENIQERIRWIRFFIEHGPKLWSQNGISSVELMTIVGDIGPFKDDIFLTQSEELYIRFEQVRIEQDRLQEAWADEFIDEQLLSLRNLLPKYELFVDAFNRALPA